MESYTVFTLTKNIKISIMPLKLTKMMDKIIEDLFLPMLNFLTRKYYSQKVVPLTKYKAITMHTDNHKDRTFKERLLLLNT